MCYPFFSLLSPRPPRSTLFPYTTLFRSQPRRRERQGAGLDKHKGFGIAVWQRLQHRSEETRLNSSHSQISYAVFCLKKKNQVGGVRAPRVGPLVEDPPEGERLH